MSEVRSLVAALAILWVLASSLVPAPAMAQSHEVAQAAETQQADTPEAIQHHTVQDQYLDCDLDWGYGGYYVGGDLMTILRVSGDFLVNGRPFSPSMSNAPDSRNIGGTNGFVQRDSLDPDKLNGLPPAEGVEYVWIGKADLVVVFELHGSRDFEGGPQNWSGFFSRGHKNDSKWKEADRQTIVEPEQQDDCDVPAVFAELVCAEGGAEIHITLANLGQEGDNESVLSYNLGSEPQPVVVVEAGDSVLRKHSVQEGETVGLLVTSPTGNFVYHKVFVVDCVTPPAEPMAEAVCDCLRHTAWVTLTNPAPDDAEPFTFTVGTGVITKVVTVAPGATQVVTFTVVEDVPMTITVTGDGFNKKFELDTDCEPQVFPLSLVLGEQCKPHGFTLVTVAAGSQTAVLSITFDDPTTEVDESVSAKLVTVLPNTVEVLTFANPLEFGDPSSLLVITNNLNEEEIRVKLVTCEQPTNLDPDVPPAQPELPFRWKFYLPATGK